MWIYHKWHATQRSMWFSFLDFLNILDLITHCDYLLCVLKLCVRQVLVFLFGPKKTIIRKVFFSSFSCYLLWSLSAFSSFCPLFHSMWTRITDENTAEYTKFHFDRHFWWRLQSNCLLENKIGFVFLTFEHLWQNNKLFFGRIFGLIEIYRNLYFPFLSIF